MPAWKPGAPRAAPLILDTGCGVGLSTLHLAAQYPDHFVIGIDQSADRLARNTHWDGPEPANLCFVRADLVDYWRWHTKPGCVRRGTTCSTPIPGPRSATCPGAGKAIRCFPHRGAGRPARVPQQLAHLCRRVHIALNQLTAGVSTPRPQQPDQPITPFERKYLASGHALWRVVADLDAQALPGSRT
jgi:tRNA G46 methylase TrmB